MSRNYKCVSRSKQQCPFGKNSGARAGVVYHLLSFPSCYRGKHTPLLINHPMGKGHLWKFKAPLIEDSDAWWPSTSWACAASASPTALLGEVGSCGYPWYTLWYHQTWIAGKSSINKGFRGNIIYAWGTFLCHVSLPEDSEDLQINIHEGYPIWLLMNWVEQYNKPSKELAGKILNCRLPPVFETLKTWSFWLAAAQMQHDRSCGSQRLGA